MLPSSSKPKGGGGGAGGGAAVAARGLVPPAAGGAGGDGGDGGARPLDDPRAALEALADATGLTWVAELEPLADLRADYSGGGGEADAPPVGMV